MIDLIKGKDEAVRGAKIKFGGSGAIGTRPLNMLYPLEVQKLDGKTKKII